MGQKIVLERAQPAPISAYRAEPGGVAKGGIVVIQEIFGVNRHVRALVDGFAELGYAAIAPALFDRIEADVELGYDEASIAKGRERVAAIGWEQPLADVASAAEALQAAGRVGVVGYCWGGSLAFLCATRLALPAVSYYGARTLPFLGEAPQAPLMMHFGERDALIPPENLAKIRAALPKAEIYTYPAGHGFNCTDRADYHAESARLALARSMTFFAEHLDAKL